MPNGTIKLAWEAPEEPARDVLAGKYSCFQRGQEQQSRFGRSGRLHRRDDDQSLETTSFPTSNEFQGRCHHDGVLLGGTQQTRRRLEDHIPTWPRNYMMKCGHPVF
jgi:hypothetical protein